MAPGTALRACPAATRESGASPASREASLARCARRFQVRWEPRAFCSALVIKGGLSQLHDALNFGKRRRFEETLLLTALLVVQTRISTIGATILRSVRGTPRSIDADTQLTVMTRTGRRKKKQNTNCLKLEENIANGTGCGEELLVYPAG